MTGGLPDRVSRDKMATPGDALYRIRAWRNSDLVVATVLPRYLASARLVDLGYEPQAAEAMIDAAAYPQ